MKHGCIQNRRAIIIRVLILEVRSFGWTEGLSACMLLVGNTR